MPAVYVKRNRSKNLTETIFDRQLINGKYKNVLANNRMSTCKRLYQRNIFGHFGCVNAVEFSSGNESYFVSGGDDRRVLLWQTVDLLCNEKPKPTVMKLCHDSNIFCLAFTLNSKRIFSAGNDHQVILHDAETGEGLDVYTLDNAVHGISLHPETDSIFCTACEDGRIQIFDVRAPRIEDPLILTTNRGSFQSVMYNPAEGRLLVSTNVQDGVQLWDVRKYERPLMHYGGAHCPKSAMSARWNSRGDSLFVLRRRMMPVLYQINKPNPVVYFDHPGYYNSCTAKSGTFGGINDNYVMSGSDNFNLYIWNIPDFDSDSTAVKFRNLAAFELKGHRSIVNQVRYSRTHDVIVSSGVEKVVKFWSSWLMTGCKGSIDDDDDDDDDPDRSAYSLERPLYTHDEYLNMVLRSGRFGMSVDPDDQTTDEDPRMMAFFDTLIQREIGASESDSEEELVFRRGPRNSARSFGLYSNEVVDSESSSLSISSDSDSNFSNFVGDPSPRYSSERLQLLLDIENGLPIYELTENGTLSRIHNSESVDIPNDRQSSSVDETIGLAENFELQEQEPSTSSNENRLDRSLGYFNTTNVERNVTKLVLQKKLKESKNRRNSSSLLNSSFSSASRSLTCREVRQRVMKAKRTGNIRQKRLCRIRRSFLTSPSDSSVNDNSDGESNNVNNSANFGVNQNVNNIVQNDLHDQLSVTSGAVNCGTSDINNVEISSDDNSVTTFAKRFNNINNNNRKRKYRQKITTSSSSEDSTDGM